jgi:hypothetical protein
MMVAQGCITCCKLSVLFGELMMQEKSVEQVTLFIRDQMTGRHVFNSEALLTLGIHPAEAQSRGFPINLPASRAG